MEDTATLAASLTASVTGPGAPDLVKVARPSTKSEWTLFGALGALCIFAAIIIAILTWAAWPRYSAPQRIWFLGWMGLLAVGGILLIVIAIASPWVGHVEASAGAAKLSLDGKS